MEKPTIGIFGGSGFYSLFEDKVDKEAGSSYIKPSAPVSVGQVGERYIAFMPRHGKKHTFPPHKIPYKSNISAFKEVGVERIIAPCAAGSLDPKVKPGDFVICDQLVDRTHGREDSFFNGPEVGHLSFAEPYCPQMRQVAIDACKDLGISYHDGGTVVVINGPRFSTRAESRYYAKQGWQVINMTQYPESVLAREQEMCYLNISLITDYDAGLDQKNVDAVTADEVVKIFNENNERVKELISEIIKNMPPERSCPCPTAMENAKM